MFDWHASVDRPLRWWQCTGWTGQHSSNDSPSNSATSVVVLFHLSSSCGRTCYQKCSKREIKIWHEMLYSLACHLGQTLTKILPNRHHLYPQIFNFCCFYFYFYFLIINFTALRVWFVYVTSRIVQSQISHALLRVLNARVIAIFHFFIWQWGPSKLDRQMKSDHHIK